MPTHKWQFAPRFRRNAFGWKSDTPIQRIKEALVEIKSFAKNDPTLAAEGAILFLEKISASLANVDSSSGYLGDAVTNAIATLVPIIAQADASRALRDKWLDRLWDARQEDEMSYIEYLGDCWGELCASPQLASKWADDLSPSLIAMWEHNARTGDFGFSKNTTPCFSALLAAGRHDDLLALIAQSEYKNKWWHDRKWGARALLAAGKHDEAIDYAEGSKGFNPQVMAVAAFCERVLLDTGRDDEAYAKYALDATEATTNLATFKAIVKKYPRIPRETILRDLVARHPGQEGKWFAAAKDAGFYDLAIELANRSPSDPRTLMRAARDFANKQPDFALASALTALWSIARGWGYEITGADVLDAYGVLMSTAAAAGVSETEIKANVRTLIEASPTRGKFVGKILAPYLVT